jgi:hypothetical protein
MAGTRSLLDVGGTNKAQTLKVTAAQRASIPAPTRDDYTVTPPVAPAPVLGGGGGGGGRSGGAAAAAAPALTLQDYINSAFPYVQQQQTNGLNLQDFDAGTLQQQQQTQAQQDLQSSQLQNSLDTMGLNSAGDLASRGLLRSGLNFQAQDKINQYGVQQHNQIAQEMTDLVNQRAQARLQQIQANNAALNNVIASLTSQFNGQNAVA